MATPHGLVVPNIKKVQSLSILEVSFIVCRATATRDCNGYLLNWCVFEYIFAFISVLNQITKELARLQDLALANKLSSNDISGGTFTLSNIGAIGGKFGSPLINVPEVSIIAMGRIQKIPQFDEDGNVYPASIMTVSTYENPLKHIFYHMHLYLPE